MASNFSESEHLTLVQLHNSLNFLYFDALYAHFPLVHNSPWIKVCMCVCVCECELT